MSEAATGNDSRISGLEKAETELRFGKADKSDVVLIDKRLHSVESKFSFAVWVAVILGLGGATVSFLLHSAQSEISAISARAAALNAQVTTLQAQINGLQPAIDGMASKSVARAFEEMAAKEQLANPNRFIYVKLGTACPGPDWQHSRTAIPLWTQELSSKPQNYIDGSWAGLDSPAWARVDVTLCFKS